MCVCVCVCVCVSWCLRPTELEAQLSSLSQQFLESILVITSEAFYTLHSTGMPSQNTRLESDLSMPRFGIFRFHCSSGKLARPCVALRS